MFSFFEWMVAMRYLRARRQEGFISVIAWFSLLGIALGVATLIIVMAVMNGFRQELLTRILGINGHLSVYGQTNQIAGFDPIAEKMRAVEGVKIVSPMVEGQVMATANGVAQGGVVRGDARTPTAPHRKLETLAMPTGGGPAGAASTCSGVTSRACIAAGWSTPNRARSRPPGFLLALLRSSARPSTVTTKM